MKIFFYTLLYCISFVVINLLIGCSPTGPSGGGDIYDVPKFEIVNAFFVSLTEGWLCGNYTSAGSSSEKANQSIIHTTDGGTTWYLQLNRREKTIAVGPQSIKSIYFISSSEGWAGGESGIFHTTNNGNDWDLQWNYKGDGCVEWIEFLDTENGWSIIGNDKTLLRTINGGDNWVSIENIPGVDFYRADFINPLTGWISNRDSVNSILHTIDGGVTWSAQQPGIYPIDVCFVDSANGWAIEYGENYPRVVRTTNGGKSWSSPTAFYNIDYFVDISFISQIEGWIGGSGGVGKPILLHTTDGGSKWTTIPISLGELRPGGPLEGGIESIHFLDSQTGWVAGRYHIANTTDGGNTWTVHKVSPHIGGIIK